MPHDHEQNEDDIVHYEGGVPIFNTRLDMLEKKAHETEKRDTEYKGQQLGLNRRLVWFTGVLAGVALLGGAISAWQAHIASQTIEEMKVTRNQTAKDNAAAILAQQKIAQQALTQSQENFDRSSEDAALISRLDERPWVVFQNFAMSGEPEEKKMPTVTISLINTGKTPGLSILAVSRVYVGREPVPILGDTSKQKPGSIGVLAPGTGAGAFSFTVPPTGYQKRPIDLYDESFNFYFIRARVTYTDVNQIPHWTNLCIFHTHGKPLNEFSYCSEGNEIDRNEKAK